jgi:glycogen(starch) synthase
MTSTLSASIVIVTFNRAASLDRTLASLHQLRYRNFEVLVVDGPSTDHTREVIAKHALFVRSFAHNVNNISISRNIGIAHAKGDVVVFIDDDAIPEPDWLEQLLAAYADPQVVAVGGFIRDATGFDYQSRYTVCDRYGNARQFHDPSEFTLDDETFLILTGANFSARRESLIAIGGFDEEYIWFLDETDVNLRMHDRGWKFAVAPGAEIHHKYEAGLTRASANVPRTMYPQLRSKAYFCVTHNLRRKRLFDILAYLADYVGKEREWKRDLARDGLTDRATVDRLIAEVERGVEDGVADALRLTAPVGLSERALADAKPGAFKLFPQRLRADQRLRLCLFSREYPPLGHGGIAQWTREVATGLAARGHEVTVISRALDGRKRIEFLEGVWVHRIEAEPISQAEADAFAPAPAALTAYSYALFREFERIDEHRCFDLISAPIADLEGLVSRRLARARVIVSLHTTYRLSLPFKPDWLSRPEYLAKHVEPTIACENQILRECSHILANSRAIVTDIETAHAVSIDRSKVEIIPHGISDLSVGVKPSAAPDERVRLLFVGRLEERKGADALLAILPGLLGRYENLVAHIVGEDGISVGETTLRAAYQRDNANRPNILDRTIFHGPLSRERVLDHYAACDVFVAPSKYESFGLIFIEAMCFGKPVVAYEVGGAAEIIEDGVNGLLAPAGRPEQLRECIARLVEDDALRRKMGRNARGTYERSYTTKLMIDRLEAYYRDVLADRRGTETRSETARMRA